VLNERPIISLQTGQIIAWPFEPVLEIATLEILALMCRGTHAKQPVLLISQDIRQYATDCFIVDNEDELTNPHEIIRLDSNLKNHYSPIGKPVFEESGRKLGTIEDYLINFETNRVQKLHVRKPLLQGLFGSNLIIDRVQITDITPARITVRDLTVTNPLLSTESIPET